MRLAVALVLVAALAPAARAGAGDDERARAHYEIGLGLYRLGDYQGALKEFAAGYELAHKPGFLLNLGQTYRKLGELREARDMYRQFLAEVPRTDPARPQAAKVLAELEAAIRAEPSVPPPPATAAAPPSAATAAPSAATAAGSSATAPAPSSATAPAPSSATAPAPSSATAPAPSAAPAPSSPEAAAAPSPPLGAATVNEAAPPRRARRGLQIAGVAVGVAGIGLLAGGIGTAVAADGEARELNVLDQTGAPFDAAKDRAYSLDHALSIAFVAGGAVAVATGVVLVVVGRR